MSRVSLPDGVAPENKVPEKKLVGLEATPTLAVPDTATPEFTTVSNRSFALPDAKRSKRVSLKGRLSDRFVEDDNDDDEDGDSGGGNLNFVHGAHAPGPIIILIAIGLVLAAIAAFVLAQNKEPTPICADQPEWNQYNCRTR